MLGETPKISRRDVLIHLRNLGFLAVTGSAGSFLRQFASTGELLPSDIKPGFRLSSELTGISINAPFAYNASEDEVQSLVDDARTIGAKNIRIFLNDKIEPSLGNFDDSEIERVKTFLSDLEERSDGQIRTTISLVDGYDLFHSDKIHPLMVANL